VPCGSGLKRNHARLFRQCAKQFAKKKAARGAAFASGN
jgi:hypothetical protein